MTVLLLLQHLFDAFTADDARELKSYLERERPYAKRGIEQLGDYIEAYENLQLPVKSVRPDLVIGDEK